MNIETSYWASPSILISTRIYYKQNTRRASEDSPKQVLKN